MNCPRCEKTVLSERERDGIMVDVCPDCRGLWLDRGELEKLIGRATRDFEDEAPRIGDDTPPRGVRPLGQPPQPRKKRWLESLGDLFD